MSHFLAESETAQQRKLDKELLQAIYAGDLDLVKKAIADGANKDTNSFSFYPLIEAVREKQKDIVCYLLSIDAQVNTPFKGEVSALMYSALNGNEEIMDLLLDHHPDVNAENARKSTALYFAVREGHINCVKKLLLAGADVFHEDYDGKSALDKFITEDIRHLLENADEFIRQHHIDTAMTGFNGALKEDMPIQYPLPARRRPVLKK